jgi:Na+-driven multidrug efflux pump
LSVFTNDEAIIQDAVNTIYLLAVCMQCFSIAVILLSALSGTGDTKVSLYIEASTISIYMLYLYYVTLVKHYPLEIIWAAELVYWILIGGLSYWRLKQKKWVVA